MVDQTRSKHKFLSFAERSDAVLGRKYVPDRAPYSLAPEGAAVECSGITTTNIPDKTDSLLFELREAMRKQEEKLEGLAQ